MGRDERRRWGMAPPRGGESVGKTPADGGKRQSADGATVQAPDNNEGVSLTSIVDDYLPSDGNRGWTSIEAVIVRFNTSFTPSGHCPVRANKTALNGLVTNLGYDAAVCAQKYEPWIIEAYNTSTGSVSALRIVGGGDGSVSISPSGSIEGGAPIVNTRYLNTTGKSLAFSGSSR